MTTNTINVHRDQVYRTVGDRGLHADVYAPVEAAPWASVLYFHGGGWEVGERTDYEATRAFALARRGVLVASVEYRLTAAAPFPAQLDDARAAADWLRTHGAAYGAPTERIGAWGASAGGHLAALLALGNPEAGESPTVEAAVAWFAPLDLAAESGGTELERELFPVSSVDGLLGGPFAPSDPRHRAADPISLVSSGASPMLLVTGDRDRVVPADVSRRMHEALTRARANSTLHVVGGLGHEDSRLEGPAGIGAVATFFEEHLKAV